MGSSIEEYDDFRPCFFESGEDEFYDAPAPSEDIWKKFELLPTPPRSPKHETIFSSVLMPTTLEKLRVVSEMLDDPITKTALSLTDICPPKCMDVCCNFNSKLIHDCMWSGHIVPQEFKIGQSTSTDCNTSSSSRGRTCSFSLTLDSTSCVDPNVAAVFPYPVNDQTRQIQREGSVGAETPSDSDSSSSSSDDEEDEEIDVVTVADKVQMAARPRLPVVSRPVLPPTPTSAASAQVAAMAMHNYTAAAPRSPKAEPSSSSSSSSSSSHRHSTSSTPRSSSSTSRSLVQKRPRHHHHHHHPTKKAKFTLSSKFSVSSSSELRTVIHKYQRLSNNARASSSNRCSSDSEDSDGRRAQHNVLERKRRNDLKSSFHRLRDAVPDLQAQERAAKVTILKKAADHILSLRRTHQTLITEHDRQKRTNEALQRRLRQLRSK